VHILSNNEFVKIGGVLTILSGFLFGLTFNQPNRLLYAWAGILGTLLIVPMALTVKEFLESEQNRLYLFVGVNSELTGAILLISLYTGALMLEFLNNTNFVAPDIVTAFQAAADSIRYLSINLGSFLTMGLGGLLFGYSSLKGNKLPRWHSYFGIAVGLLNFTWLVWWQISFFNPGQIGFMIPFIAYILFIVWQIILGIYMIRAKE